MTRPFNKKSRREENLPQNEANKMVKIFHSSHVASFMAFWRSSHPSKNHAWVRFFRADEVFFFLSSIANMFVLLAVPIGWLKFRQSWFDFFSVLITFFFPTCKMEPAGLHNGGKGEGNYKNVFFISSQMKERNLFLGVPSNRFRFRRDACVSFHTNWRCNKALFRSRVSYFVGSETKRRKTQRQIKNGFFLLFLLWSLHSGIWQLLPPCQMRCNLRSTTIMWFFLVNFSYWLWEGYQEHKINNEYLLMLEYRMSSNELLKFAKK